MAKEDKNKKQPEEMSLEEAAAFRASLFKPQKEILSMEQKREQFRIFWAQKRNEYPKVHEMENILWAHMVAVNLTDPEDFEKGLKHFGLKKVRGE